MSALDSHSSTVEVMESWRSHIIVMGSKNPSPWYSAGRPLLVGPALGDVSDQKPPEKMVI